MYRNGSIYHGPSPLDPWLSSMLARHGRPPSRQLRSLYADELRGWVTFVPMLTRRTLPKRSGDQAETALKAGRAVSGIPIATRFVGAVSALSFSVWHGLSPYARTWAASTISKRKSVRSVTEGAFFSGTRPESSTGWRKSLH
jgi:hypothetical protein